MQAVGPQMRVLRTGPQLRWRGARPGPFPLSCGRQTQVQRGTEHGVSPLPRPQASTSLRV